MSESRQPYIQARFLDNANYALSRVYVPQLHLLVEFDGQLDATRLKKALRLTMVAEPVLGCRFVPRCITPHWAGSPRETATSPPLLREKAADEQTLQRCLDRFLREPVLALQGPQLKALLLRSKEGDRLIVKLNHQVVDAGGAKDFGYLLASLYRRSDGHPDHVPPANSGTRSLRQVYGRFPKTRLLKILCRFFMEFVHNMIPYKSITYPSGMAEVGDYTFAFKRFSRERVTALKAYGKKMSATVNDLMVTALLRAYVRQCKWNGNGALRMVGTVDLRRYVPNGRAKALCNLSSFYFLHLGHHLGNGFDDTLRRVKNRMDVLKAADLGLSFALGNYLFLLPYPFVLKAFISSNTFSRLAKTGNMPPSMTNLGPIDDKALDFGSPGVTGAEIWPPPCYPPLLVPGLSGFRDTLTLSVGFFESAIEKKNLEELFDMVDQELPC
ncbi:MAG: hypothetical protein SWQ30_17670 [Thermodesulfobacteriota bacterium]|nr:hypothetical protein [Thermodesulfobacteriota bacterium]